MLSKRWEALLESAELPGELVPGQPLLELAGQNRALVEGHRGIVEYGRERIRVRVKFGIICICGTGLELTRMTGSQLVISGQIGGITLEGGR